MVTGFTVRVHTSVYRLCPSPKSTIIRFQSVIRPHKPVNSLLIASRHQMIAELSGCPLDCFNPLADHGASCLYLSILVMNSINNDTSEEHASVPSRIPVVMGTLSIPSQ